MALQSWSIASFPNIDPDATPTPILTETITLLDSGVSAFVILSMLVANNSESEATVVVKRLSSTDEVKFSWTLVVPAGNSPVALNSMMSFRGGDKLSVTSNVIEVAIDATGDEVH